MAILKKSKWSVCYHQHGLTCFLMIEEVTSETENSFSGIGFRRSKSDSLYKLFDNKNDAIDYVEKYNEKFDKIKKLISDVNSIIDDIKISIKEDMK